MARCIIRKSSPFQSFHHEAAILHHTKVWKKLPNSLKNERDLVVFKEKLKEKIKPKKYFHFKFGSKRGNALLTQLRVGR